MPRDPQWEVDELRHISRIEQEDRPDGRSPTKAWIVRLGPYDDGLPAVVRTFSDGRFGGTKKSLEAAIHYRNEQEAGR